MIEEMNQYPILLQKKFNEKVQEGARVEFEVRPSEGVLGFAWIVYLIDKDEKKWLLVTTDDLEPYEIKSPNHLVTYMQKQKIAGAYLPAPDPEKYQLYSKIKLKKSPRD